MISPEIYELGVPVLGICYGAQLTAKLLGGKVEYSDKHEYGRAQLSPLKSLDLFEGFEAGVGFEVWMSHGDRVETLPDGFHLVGKSENSPDRPLPLACMNRPLTLLSRKNRTFGPMLRRFGIDPDVLMKEE